MIVKSMARKSATFGQLLDYFEAARELGPAFTHNLLSPVADQEAIHREFMANAALLPPRKNGNVLYHEILSFAAADRAQVTSNLLTDLARRYLALRAPYALAYVRIHLDTACPHAHLLISANNYTSRRRLRLSHQAFQSVKRSLETYQRQQYPQLTHSVAQVPRRGSKGPRRRRGEDERRRRGERRLSQKESLRRQVGAALATAQDGETCYRQLLAQGLRLYQRGRRIGVEVVPSGRRYRLQTLGLDDAFTAARASWRRTSIRGPDQESPARERSRDRGLDLDR